MKRLFMFLFSLMTLIGLSSCGKNSVNEKAVYEKIVSLTDGYTSDHIEYSAVLTSEEMNLTLTNTGILTKENDAYTYTYSYQYLNKIGSGAEELVSTDTGTITGTKEEILTEGFAVDDTVKVVALDLSGSFKTYKVTASGDFYVMKGYITRNTILKNTENLDDDIRFDYELTVDKEVTEIQSFVISYVTVRFDSVKITITF